MQIFINETSLNTQFENKHVFFDALKLFLSSIKRIGEIRNDKEILKSNSFFYYTGVKDTYLETLLKENPSLNSAFVQNMQLVNPKNWEKQKIHEDHSTYKFLQDNYTGTSVAELSERKIQKHELLGFLLNFKDSQFGDSPNIQVVKNSNNTISVDCVVSPESIDQWLIDCGFINPNEDYDESSDLPPLDIQTVLRDETIFEKTTYPRNNGRIVYRRKGTHELWTVDSAKKHAGIKAHIEVFDENTTKHLGTSLYNVIQVNDKHKKNDRTINLEY